MKKLIRGFTLLSCIIIGISAAGTANAYVFDMGAGSSIDTSGTADALVMYAVVNPNLDSITFDLEVGQTSDSFYFGRIGSSEKWINNDDKVPGSMITYMDFDSPDLTTTVDGMSVGFVTATEQGWEVTWDDPQNIITAAGLDFTINLTDAFWSGDIATKGSDKVYATVTLNAVPLPAPLLLLGTGLFGLVSVRRKFSR